MRDGEDGGSDSGAGSDQAEEDDVEMKEGGESKPVRSSDPNDMSAFKMDEYDEEESKGVGE